MHNVITIGGERMDTSDKLQSLLLAHSVYVDDIQSAYTEAELVPSDADEQTAALLLAIGKANRARMTDQPQTPFVHADTQD